MLLLLGLAMVLRAAGVLWPHSSCASCLFCGHPTVPVSATFRIGRNRRHRPRTPPPSVLSGVESLRQGSCGAGVCHHLIILRQSGCGYVTLGWATEAHFSFNGFHNDLFGMYGGIGSGCSPIGASLLSRHAAQVFFWCRSTTKSRVLFGVEAQPFHERVWMWRETMPETKLFDRFVCLSAATSFVDESLRIGQGICDVVPQAHKHAGEVRPIGPSAY